MATTFFTAADRLYEYFAIPYALCALSTNPDAYVEICLEDPIQFADRNASAIRSLQKHFPGRFHFRGGTFGDRMANSVRFLETPEVMSEYTYIGDIDILVLEHAAPQHVANMQRTGLPYSNILRPEGGKLSGLHFTRTEAYYPVEASGLDLTMNDEALLFYLARKGGLPGSDETWRPIHGIHLSPNRRPIGVPGEPGWGFRHRQLALAFYRIRDSEAWSDIEPHFDLRFVAMQLLLQTAFDCSFPDLLTQSPRGRKFTHLLKRLQQHEEISTDILRRQTEEIARLKRDAASREAEIARLREQVATVSRSRDEKVRRLTERFGKVRERQDKTIAQLKAELATVINSRSWQMTAPFRAISTRTSRMRRPS